MNDFDNKYDIVDENTPPNTLMSGHYKRSFAHYTLRERLPIIITQVIDNLSRDKEQIIEEHGDEAREELKDILGNISKLKYELQTDKEMTPFTGNEEDKELWNKFLETLTSNNNTYFKTCWLYAECYMYRKLKSIFESTNLFKNFDYFRKQKENALTCCTDTLENVINSIQKVSNENNFSKEQLFITLLKLNLWGNRCDLSITAGKEIKQTGNPFSIVDSLDEYILVDDTKDITNCIFKSSVTNNKNNNSTLNSTSSNVILVDIVNDNSGYELFTDFIIADYLISNNLATKVRFHVKAIPWFISDVTEHDFKWTLNYLNNHESKILQNIGKKWSNYMNNGCFELSEVEYFWTSPYEFYRMAEICPKLYGKLSESNLVIFKGDLNYRKLIGDFTWDFTEKFKTCLRGFLPSNICTLRTVKADLICGLKPGISDQLFKKDPKWMTTGEYGVIQFASKND